MSGPNTLNSSNLGERVSILFSIPDDPEHPFSEVTGVLQRVTDADGPDARYCIVRRSGEVVEVRQDAIMKLKILPAGSGPLRTPAAWQDGGS